MKPLPLLLAALLIAPTLPSPRAVHANGLKEGILLGHEVAITARQAALKEIERRALLEIQRLEKWLSFYEGLRGSLDQLANELLTDKQTLIRRMSRTAQYVASLARNPDDFVGTPEGSFSPRKIQEKVRSLESALAVLNRAINASDQAFFLLGWHRHGTGKDLKRLMDETREKIALVRRQTEDGTYRILYPIPGGSSAVTGQKLEKEIAYHRGEIERKSRLIDEGEYSVAVPGFPRHMTRNSIEKVIQSEKERIAEIIEQRNRKEYKIWTPFSANPLHQKHLEDMVAKLKNAVATTDAAFADGSWKTYFPVFGRQSLAGLKQSIERHQERLAKHREKLAKGDLAVHVPGVGRVTRNQVQKWLDGLAGKTDAKTSERRAGLTATLPKIASGGALMVEHEQVDIQRLDRALKLAPELVKPWKTRKDLEIAERTRVIEQDFRDAAARHVSEIERNIKKIERLRDIFIP